MKPAQPDAGIRNLSSPS